MVSRCERVSDPWVLPASKEVPGPEIREVEQGSNPIQILPVIVVEAGWVEVIEKAPRCLLVYGPLLRHISIRNSRKTLSRGLARTSSRSSRPISSNSRAMVT